MGSQRVGHNRATEHAGKLHYSGFFIYLFFYYKQEKPNLNKFKGEKSNQVTVKITGPQKTRINRFFSPDMQFLENLYQGKKLKIVCFQNTKGNNFFNISIIVEGD